MVESVNERVREILAALGEADLIGAIELLVNDIVDLEARTQDLEDRLNSLSDNA